jgi:hypothetical protein
MTPRSDANKEIFLVIDSNWIGNRGSGAEFRSILEQDTDDT